MIDFSKRIKIFLFLSQYIIFSGHYDFISTKALVGENVRSVENEEFPYVVSVMRIQRRSVQSVNDHLCTGTLFTPQDVLTADHCLRKTHHPSRIQIIVGSIDLFLGTKYYPLWWMNYNQWASRKSITLEYQINDILVIKLTRNVSNIIRLPVISTSLNDTLFGFDVQLVGWGKTNNGEISRILQKATVKLLKNEECSRKIYVLSGVNYFIEERYLCTAANPHVLMDNGDSGGPVLYTDTVIGINYGLCPDIKNILHPGQVNLHFSTAYYKNFISDIITNYLISF